MEELLSIVLPAIVNLAPQLVQDVKDLLQKKGYTNEQIDAIFNQIPPYEKLGINPDHPVALEPGSPVTPPVPPAQPGTIAATAVHVSARPADWVNPNPPSPGSPIPITQTPAAHVSARPEGWTKPED